MVRVKFGEWQNVLEVLEAGQVCHAQFALALRLSLMSTVAQDAMAREIPSGDASNTSLSSSQLAAARDLRALLDELDGVQAARKRLVEAASTAVEQADVRAAVALHSDNASASASQSLASFEPMLEAELRKLADPYERELRASESRQEDVLSNVKVRLLRSRAFASLTASLDQALYEAFVQQRQSRASLRGREKALQRFDMAHVKYFEMLTNLKEGLKFYADLSKLAGELRDSVKTVRPRPETRSIRD